MRSVMGFLSLLALGLFAATAISLLGLGTAWGPRIPQGMSATSSGMMVHYPSLLTGLVTGFIVASLGNISWADLPRRAALWLVANQWNFFYLVAALGLASIVYFY